MAPAMHQRPAALGPVEPLQPTVAVVGVALEMPPAAAVEEPLGVGAVPAGRVAEDHDGRRRAAMGAVVGGHGPEEALLRGPAPRIEHRQGRLVHEQARGARQMGVHPLDDRLEVEAGAADPIAEGRAVEVDALAAEDLGLAVQRQVVGEFRDDGEPARRHRFEPAGERRSAPRSAGRRGPRARAHGPAPPRPRVLRQAHFGRRVTSTRNCAGMTSSRRAWACTTAPARAAAGAFRPPRHQHPELRGDHVEPPRVRHRP